MATKEIEIKLNDLGANSFYVWKRTRKGDWGKFARGRIHQLPSNIVRTSLRDSTLSHVKEWKPASGKEKQGPLSEVISSLAMLFAHPLLLHMLTNIGPGTRVNVLLGQNALS